MIIEKVENIIKASLEAAGYCIVRIRFDGLKRKILQIMIDRLDSEAVSIKDCEKVNKIVSTLFIVDDPIDEHYHLEISSAGIDRPLVRLADFVRYIGERVILKTKHKLDDRNKHRGVLKAAKDDKITVEIEDGDDLEIDFYNIQDAKLDIERFLYNKGNKMKSQTNDEN